MRLLLDSHLLIWATTDPDRLSASVQKMIDDPSNLVWFSTATIWELAIKQQTKRSNLTIDLAVMRETLLANRYQELVVNAQHALAIRTLPLLHRDPFDRLLLAQAIVEGATLLTADKTLAGYPAPVYLI